MKTKKHSILCGSIRDDDLARWIDASIPANTLKLLVLIQCNGSDMADEFADKENTVVLSATSAGEEAKFVQGAEVPSSSRKRHYAMASGCASNCKI